MWSDLRHAVRTLIRQPAFTVTALLTLALGIGATTAIFSVVHGVLLRPLPYPDPGQLVQLSEEHPGGTKLMDMPWLSNFTFDAWRRSATTLEAMATYSDGMATVGDTHPERLRDAFVSPSLFGLLKVAPVAGRFFVEDEATDAASHVVVLSEGLWRERYGAAASAIGQHLMVNGVSHEIVGVAPGWFAFPEHGLVLWRPDRGDRGRRCLEEVVPGEDAEGDGSDRGDVGEGAHCLQDRSGLRNVQWPRTAGSGCMTTRDGCGPAGTSSTSNF